MSNALASRVLCILIASLLASACASGQQSNGEGAEWTELFPDQDWNDFPPESVSTFTGTVRFEEADPLPSYVMRFNPYKLEMESGTLDIYLGSSDVLESWIDREIEIRGVIEEMSVEGHLFIEIWPTDYRPVR